MGSAASSKSHFQSFQGVLGSKHQDCDGETTQQIQALQPVGDAIVNTAIFYIQFVLLAVIT